MTRWTYNCLDGSGRDCGSPERGMGGGRMEKREIGVGVGSQL